VKDMTEAAGCAHRTSWCRQLTQLIIAIHQAMSSPDYSGSDDKASRIVNSICFHLGGERLYLPVFDKLSRAARIFSEELRARNDAGASNPLQHDDGLCQRAISAITEAEKQCAATP
jgi:hypothetical protein